MSDLTESEYAAIGRVAQTWAFYEGCVNLLIGGMLGGGTNQSALVGPAMGSRLAMEFAAGLATAALSKKDAAVVGKLMKRGGGLASRRNDVVHQMWVRGEKAGKLAPVGLKVRQQIKLAGGHSTEKEFLALSREIEDLIRELLRFLQAHDMFELLLAELPPEPQHP